MVAHAIRDISNDSLVVEIVPRECSRRDAVSMELGMAGGKKSVIKIA